MVLSSGRVPNSHVFNFVTDAEQAVARTQYIDSMVVTHQRVFELGERAETSEISGVKIRVFEDEGVVRVGLEGVAEMQLDEIRIVDQRSPQFRNASEAEEMLYR